MQLTAKRVFSGLTAGFAIAVGGYLWLELPTPFEGNWTKFDQGWHASEVAKSSGDFCICPAYECDLQFEGTTVVSKRVIAGKSVRYLRPPITEANASTTRQNLKPVYGKKYCIEKNAGEKVVYELIDQSGSYWLRIL